MSKPTFQQRLQACLADGNLRVADLARWFERPHATIRDWVQHGREPNGGPMDVAFVKAELGRIEKLIARGITLPVPRMAPQARIEYLARLRNGK